MLSNLGSFAVGWSRRHFVRKTVNCVAFQCLNAKNGVGMSSMEYEGRFFSIDCLRVVTGVVLGCECQQGTKLICHDIVY